MAGETVALFLTGLGVVAGEWTTGSPATGIAITFAQPTVTVAGIFARVTYSGLAPGLVGVYQINIRVPQVPGDATEYPLVVRIGDQVSNTVTIAAQRSEIGFRPDVRESLGGGPPGGTIWKVVADPVTPDTVYALGGFGLFKSENSGEAWTLISADLPRLYSFATDPTRPGTLYAGSFPGTVYKSIDGGSSWTRIASEFTFELE